MKNLMQYGHCAWALTVQKPKEVGFLALMMIFISMAVYKSTPAMVDKVFELNIYKNKAPINNIFQERDIAQSKVVWVDKLMLKRGSLLKHGKLGAIGFSDSYFIDVESDFTVKKAGVYYFIPGSDDGFSLEVDGRRLCAYEKARPYATQRCRVELDEGVHRFRMEYYQGGGHSGMTLAYQFKGDDKKRWVGENSRYLKF
ncbi:hypothetical protein [Marinagarivorans algicola]|uniref:hypothetical protein n=1 Tax=Marinagarivorans algicola TaxID=1513270 RepID=UPI0006B9B75A|nr:hypothetical protein [Marinagarivorans algicola]